MSETIDDLRILAKQVRNASSQGENTAERVGHVMEGTLDLIEVATPDLSKYYTKQESDTLLLSKWTYDAARAASWDAASKDRHTHANKSVLDLIVYDPVKNVWNFTGNAAFSGDVISYANLGDVDVPTIYEGLPIDNRTIKRDINGVLFAESTTGGSFDESSMWAALGTSISSKLIAQRYLNLSGYATETYVTEKIQGLGAVFNLKGTKTTPSDLPTTGNKVGDVWYVASESVGYIWITDETGVLRWEKFGEPVDLSAYYTKNETNALLANKWTTDTVLISHWNDAYTLRHSHSNKDIIDGITNTLINNWNSSAADAHKHANKPALDLIEYDSVKKLWKFTGNAAFSGDVISYANLGDLNIPGIYEGLPIDNVTIKRNSAGALYSLSGSGGDFDKAAMWLALASSTAEQINKSHLTDALSTYVLTTDSRLSDSRNAKDVYAWAKQPMKPTYGYDEITGTPPAVDLSNYVTLNTDQSINGHKSFRDKITICNSALVPYNGFELQGTSTIAPNMTFHFPGKHANILFMDYASRLNWDGLAVYAKAFAIENGTANQVLRADGGVETFEYSGQPGQPDWVWGAISRFEHRVWNPANFNVASAAKLQTPRSIWGQLYDGTGNIDGNFSTSGTGTFGEYLSAKGLGASGNIYSIGDASADSKYGYISVMRSAAVNNATAFAWVRSGIIAFGIGHNTSNQMILGQGVDNKTLDPWLKFDKSAIYTQNILATGYVNAQRIFAGFDAGVPNSMSCSDWFRSSGPTGWFNQTFGGGIHMQDSKYVRVYNGKAFAVDNTENDSIKTLGGIVAEGNTLQLGNIKLVVNPSAKTIRFEMLDGTPCNIVSTGDVIIYN